MQQLKPIAEAVGLTMAQLAVAWVLQNPNVSAAIIGASRPEQVSENVKAAGVKLAGDVMKQIDEVLGAHVVRRPGADGVAGDAAVAVGARSVTAAAVRGARAAARSIPHDSPAAG